MTSVYPGRCTNRTTFRAESTTSNHDPRRGSKVRRPGVSTCAPRQAKTSPSHAHEHHRCIPQENLAPSRCFPCYPLNGIRCCRLTFRTRLINDGATTGLKAFNPSDRAWLGKVATIDIFGTIHTNPHRSTVYGRHHPATMPGRWRRRILTNRMPAREPATCNGRCGVFPLQASGTFVSTHLPSGRGICRRAGGARSRW